MKLTLLIAIIGAAGCAAGAAHPSYPTTYACSDQTLQRQGDQLAVGGSHQALGWRDGEGDHFVTWPLAPGDVDATEYVVPSDHLQDASKRIYDVTNGSSRADWRLVTREACTASGGYNDVLAHWMRGESLDELATKLALSDRDEARALLHTALYALQKRYYQDR
jgi:hypothetical protein